MSAPRFIRTKLQNFLFSGHNPLDFCDTFVCGGRALASRWVAQNKRPYQEDFLTVDIVDDFQTQLSTPKRKLEAAKTTISIVDEIYGQEVDCGSTVCTAVISREFNDAYNIILTGLGDSSAYFVDPDNLDPRKKVILLNKWHTPKDPDEKKYIEAHGGHITHNKLDLPDVDRVDHDLMMTRTLGDKRHICLNREADVTYKDGHLGTSKKFIVICSDGLTDTLKPYEILNIVTQHQNNSPLTIAAYLGTAATHQNDSFDNTSVGVIPIHDIPNNTSIFGGVFDGHARKGFSGRNVSYPAGRNYSYVLKKVTALYIAHPDNNIPEEKITALKNELKVNKQKVEAFKKIYNALRDSQSGIFKHNFLTEEHEHLSDVEMLKTISDYARQNQDSRTAKAWELTTTHYANCKKENLELVKEIHIASFERTWFGKSNLFSPSTPIALPKPRTHSITNPKDLKSEWESRLFNNRTMLDQTIKTHEGLKPDSRTAVIRKRLG